MNHLSLVTPYGPNESTCGYCSPPGSRSETEYNRTSANLTAIAMTCEAYQKMIDRGWRRSGTYCYKPDLKNSCCPQYAIRLDALKFKPSKGQRKIIRRWSNFIQKGDGGESMVIEGDTVRHTKRTKRPVRNSETTLASTIHAAEVGWIDSDSAVHRFETILEPSAYTLEKYQLYEKYQTEIHHDTLSTPQGFKSFLCDSPLRSQPIHYVGPSSAHLPPSYGSYHQLYRVDGELIAMAVLDILPSCVSSVYFMYDKKWEKFSFGKLSAFREASLAYEIHEAGVLEMTYLYMGFYIHSCQKMRYKGEYTPSFLADPETYEWYPLETCVKLLDQNRYACFSSTDHSTPDPPMSSIDPPEPPIPSTQDLEQIYVVKAVRAGTIVIERVHESRYWESEYARSSILHCISGLGLEVSKDVVFAF